MQKAKELRTEAERAEIEAERMRELAKLEAELKAKDETTTEMAKHEPISLNSNETISEEGEGEEVAPSSEIGAGTTEGESAGMEKENVGEGHMEEGMKQEGIGGGETAFSQDEEPKTEEGNANNTSETAMVKDEHKDVIPLTVTGSSIEGENEDAVTAIQFQHQQEALITTHSSSTTRPQGEEVEGICFFKFIK
jgi:hypothetical protein